MPNERSTLTPHPSAECISDALKCLIACCQTELSEKETECILSYLGTKNLLSQSDPETPPLTSHSSLLTAMASRHGILPLVYKTLKRLSESHSSLEHVLTDFKSAYVQTAQRNIFMSAELLKIMNLLKENNIEALAFKGPSLSQMAYGDITLRQFGDLDILIDEHVVARAGKILADNGFKPIHSMKILTNPICLEIDKDFSFFTKSGQIHIEMHWRLVPKGLNTYFNFNKLMEEKQSVPINGKAVPTLSLEHLLTYLCIHGSKHAWERIEWVCDIDRLVRTNDIDWDKVLIYTKSKNDLRPLLLGLLLSQKFFQTPLPDLIVKMMADEPQLNDLTSEVISFFNNASISTNDLRRIYLIESFVAQVFHEKQHKTLTFLKQLFKVSRRDCQYFLLPKKLKFLYIFLRPVRLILTRLNYSDK